MTVYGFSWSGFLYRSIFVLCCLALGVAVVQLCVLSLLWLALVAFPSLTPRCQESSTALQSDSKNAQRYIACKIADNTFNAKDIHI